MTTDAKLSILVKMSDTVERKKVLIVEDDESLLDLIKQAVETEGYITETVNNAQDAMERIKTFQPHLVLTDNDMPEVTGIQMLKELRKQQNYVTVIFLSGRTDTNFVVEALKAGADDYIRKPFRFNELTARMESSLRNNDLHRELLEANQKLSDLVDHDYLTGLYNMRSMYNKIDYELKRAKRTGGQVTCIMMDMDHFKSVNDGHDHLFGSFVIKETGALVEKAIREVDFAARYGGDEYLIVLTDSTKEGASIVAERLRKAIEEHLFKEGEDEIKQTVSLGVALSSPDEEIDSRTLVRRADEALYAAKDKGRNTFSVYGEE